MSWIRVGIAGCLFLVCCANLHASPQRHALVIGNDSYRGNALLNARNDARAMAAKLRALGYVTTLALDVNKAGMVEAFATYSSSLAVGDDALVYYAGHGLQVDGENMLVPTDFEVSGESGPFAEGYPLSSVLTQIMARGARVKVIILDACRDNPYRHDRSLRSGWSPMRASADTYLAFGTAPGQTASDNSRDGHGLFTDALLRHLDAPVDIDLMFRAVRLEVVTASGGAQTPWASSSLVDSFHLDPQLDLEVARSLPWSLPQANGSSGLTYGASPAPIGDRSVGAIVDNRLGAHIDEDAAALSEAAYAKIRGFHFEEALPLLEAVLAIDPHAALALRALGLILHLLGRHVEAQQALTRAVHSNPDDPVARAYWCMFASTDVYKMECTPMLEAHPEISSARLVLAFHYLSGHNDEAALPQASAALSLNKESVAALMMRGQIALDTHQAALAEQAFIRANELLLAAPRTSQ